MDGRAITKFSRISARKARLVADLVRGKKVEDAINILGLTPKKASPILQKTIMSAVANAKVAAEENVSLSDSDFVIKEVRVDEGPTMKRIRPRAQGRAFRILKRTSHIKVIVAPVQ
jgi:large subunit ribosomal protein L22